MEPTQKEVFSKLNEALLPQLDTLLLEINLSHRQRELIKMGVTETRHILRLKKMDYQMMVSIFKCTSCPISYL